MYKFSRKQNFARINFRDWRFQLFRGNLFSRISRMKKFLCISRGEIFANFASRRFFKLWRKLIFELRPSHIRPRRGHISFWSSYHTITSSECTYHQWPPIWGSRSIIFNSKWWYSRLIIIFWAQFWPRISFGKYLRIEDFQALKFLCENNFANFA